MITSNPSIWWLHGWLRSRHIPIQSLSPIPGDFKIHVRLDERADEDIARRKRCSLLRIMLCALLFSQQCQLQIASVIRVQPKPGGRRPGQLLLMHHCRRAEKKKGNLVAPLLPPKKKLRIHCSKRATPTPKRYMLATCRSPCHR